MPSSEMIPKHRIALQVDAPDRTALLKAIVETVFLGIESDFAAGDTDRLLFALEEREKLGGTGLRNGVAIPHAKIPGLKEMIVGLAISKEGHDFNALDKKPSRIFVTMLSPDMNDVQHLRALAKIARVFSVEERVAELLQMHDVDAVYDMINQPEFWSLKT